MPDDPRVDELLEDLLDSGGTPEEACGSCPELLPQVRAGWQRLRAVKAEVNALFHEFPFSGGATPSAPLTADLPRIRSHEVREVLGRGGMGIVYKAWHLRLHRPVAVKMLLAGAYAQPQERERFLRESETVAGLRHANIVQVHEAGDVDGRPYFTMEFVEGGSLAQKLAGTPQPAGQAAALVAEVAEAVHAAHQRGVVHRDLKPSNILLTVDGTPKISDFGLARRLEGAAGLTQSGAPMGTPSYMAPEQAEGKSRDVGPAADIYALGAILYELLTGRPPFRAETAAETIRQVVFQDPAPPSRLNAAVPRDLETICLKCLHKEPPRRYASAAALAEDLQRYGRGEQIAARPGGRLERPTRWVRRHPAAAVLLAAVAVLVATTGIGGFLLYQQQFAARARQTQTDQEVRAILARARVQLEEAWHAADTAKLKDAEVEGKRAEDVARSGGATTVARQEVEAFGRDAAERLGRAKKNQALLRAVLDVSASQEISDRVRDQVGRMLVLAQPSVDEQYAAAFRAWGLNVDGTAEAEVVARLDAEPGVVVQELIAALDNWMLERRRQKRPEARWRHLLRVAEHLDHSERHRTLRALLIGVAPPRLEDVAGLVGTASPWPVLLQLARGSAWRQLLELRREIDPRTEPVLTMALLAQAFAEAGDAARAEQVLAQAVAVRPDQVLLLTALGNLAEQDGPSRLGEAIGYYRAARGLRRHLGIALSRALMRASRPAQAEAVLHEMVPQQPDNFAVWFYLGFALGGQRRHGEAAAAYRRALDLRPDFPEAYTNLANSLRCQGRYGQAEAACRKAIVLNPDLALAHINLAYALNGQRRHGEAEAACRKALDLQPDSAMAYTLLGKSLGCQRRYREAEAACRKALDLKPDFVMAHNFLALALSDQQRHGEAEAACRKALDLQPDSAMAYSTLGSALSAQGKQDEAVAAYRKALDLGPDDTEPYTNLDRAMAHYHLGCVLKSGQRYDEAEAAYRKAIALWPDLAEAHCNLGQLLGSQGRYSEAETACRKAIALRPDLAQAHTNLGQLLGRQGRYGEAETACRKAIALRPDLAQAHGAFGVVLTALHRYSEAEAACRKAIGLRPDLALAHYHLGIALGQQRFDEAAAALQMAGKLLPPKNALRERVRQLQDEYQRFATLDARLPLILARAEKPANAAEEVEFARLCGLKKLYAAAAHFYGDAFTADPKRAEDVPRGTRYYAACAAAQAGCAHGRDADALDDKGCAHWRRQAREWLRQDLTWWMKALDSGSAKTKAEVRWRMWYWQTDSDLAGVRAKDALARLPDEERKQWERLWSDVDALLRRVSPSE